MAQRLQSVFLPPCQKQNESSGCFSCLNCDTVTEENLVGSGSTIGDGRKYNQRRVSLKGKPSIAPIRQSIVQPAFISNKFSTQNGYLAKTPTNRENATRVSNTFLQPITNAQSRSSIQGAKFVASHQRSVQSNLMDYYQNIKDSTNEQNMGKSAKVVFQYNKPQPFKIQSVKMIESVKYPQPQPQPSQKQEQQQQQLINKLPLLMLNKNGSSKNVSSTSKNDNPRQRSQSPFKSRLKVRQTVSIRQPQQDEYSEVDEDFRLHPIDEQSHMESSHHLLH